MNWDLRLPDAAVGRRCWGVLYLWDYGYYDGPLEGLCWQGGKEYWFACFMEEELRVPLFRDEEKFDFLRHRMFHLIDLTPEQMEYQKTNHEKFLIDQSKGREQYYKERDEDPTHHIVTYKQIVGWFDENDAEYDKTHPRYKDYMGWTKANGLTTS